MLEIRHLRLEDAARVEAILMSTFDGINPAGITERHVALGPESCFVAVDDGQVVGMVCATQYDRLAYIGPMAVEPGVQGKGIGRALFKRLIATLEAQECVTMLLDATPAGELLYRNFGFVESSQTLDLGRERGPGITRLPDADGLGRAAALDQSVFGANRLPIFRRLVEKEGGALFSSPESFLISQTRVLGPFVAKDPTSAEALLDKALLEGAVAARVLAPVENPFAERLFLNRGFTITRKVKQMRRGPAIAGMRRELMYGLASFALG